MGTYLYTKEQVRLVMRGWGAGDAPLPTKKTKIVVSFPPPASLNVAEITLSGDKSTDGKRLYQVKLGAC